MSLFYMAVAVIVAVRGRKRHPFVHRCIEKNGHNSSLVRRVPQHFVNLVQRQRWRRRPHLFHISCAVTPCPPPPPSPLPFPSFRKILLNKTRSAPPTSYNIYFRPLRRRRRYITMLQST